MKDEFKLITVYDAGSTDGYTHSRGTLYRSEALAETKARELHDGYGRVQSHTVLDNGDVRVWMLASTTPIALGGTQAEAQQERKVALSKLTDKEKELLGLNGE